MLTHQSILFYCRHFFKLSGYYFLSGLTAGFLLTSTAKAETKAATKLKQAMTTGSLQKQDAIVLPATATQADQAPVVAVLDFESNTLTPAEVQAFSAALWTRMGIEGNLRLLPRAETRTWLIRNDLYPSMPYQPPVPLARVARALHADQVLSGRIDRIKDAWNFELAMQKVDKESPIQVVHAQLGTLEDIMLLIEKAATQARAQAQGLEYQPIVFSQSSIGTKTPVSHTKSKTMMTVKRAKSNLKAENPVKATKDERKEPELAAAKPQKQEVVSEPVNKPQVAGPERGGTAAAELESTTTLMSAKATIRKESAQNNSLQKEFATVSMRPAGINPTASPTPAVALSRAPAMIASTPTAAAVSPQELLSQAMELEPKSPERLAKLEQAAAAAPADSAIQVQLATTYYEREQFDQTISACDRAISHCPNNSMLPTVKGSALFNLRRFDQAKAAHAAALKIDPANNWARYNLALALSQMHSPEAAAAWRDYLTRAKDDPAQSGLLAKAREQLTATEKSQPPVSPANSALKMANVSTSASMAVRH